MLLLHQSHLAYVHHSHNDPIHLDLLYHDALLSASHLGATDGIGIGIRGSSSASSPSLSTPTAAGLDDASVDDEDSPNANVHEKSTVPLPAIVPSDTSVSDSIRKMIKHVSGKGDPIHLGGLVDFDATQSVSPRVFQLVRSNWGAQSLMDVGCGRGWSASWFHLQGVNTTCVEASPDALRRTLLPSSALVNHDFTRGPWHPKQTIDVAWCTSFVQQVARPHMRNYVETLKRAAIVLLSAPTTPEAAASGWHAVEVHRHDWWVVQLERHGFVLSRELTSQVREAARLDSHEATTKARGPDGARYRTSDLALDALVFLNPRVSSRPRHDHLFPEIGCVDTTSSGPGAVPTNGTIVRRECGYGQRGQKVEPTLDSSHLPPPVHAYLTDRWVDLVKKNLPPGEHHPLPEDDTAARSSKASAPDRPSGGAAPNNATLDWSQHAIHVIPHLVDAGQWADAVARKVPVVVWPLWEFKHQPKVVTADARHIEMDGVEESPFLELSHDPNNFHPDVVWVGNTGYGHGWNLWCQKFREHVVTAQQNRRRLGLPTSWPIVIVDFTDYPSRQRCKAVEDDVGAEYVTYTKRSLAKDRTWDPAKNWVNEGVRVPDRSKGTGILYRHTPLAVRTDTVLHVREALERRNVTLKDAIEELERPIDVMHLWPVDANVSKTVGTVQSNLRSTVSAAIAELGASTPDLNVYVGLAGDVSVVGRRTVSSSYVEALLSTKILVVSQRDRWEDHYRLFEALVGGPLVMTDRMLGMPAGLKNGTSIIEYTSAAELQSLILHYARNDAERNRIAAEGRRVALARHRSWHRMEEAIFGRPLTTCPLIVASSGAVARTKSGCPYVVHANETL